MKNFTTDVKMLAELDAIIKEQERAAKPDPAVNILAGALMPGFGGKLLNAGQQMAAHKLDVLTRVKDRLAEFIEKEYADAE